MATFGSGLASTQVTVYASNSTNSLVASGIAGPITLTTDSTNNLTVCIGPGSISPTSVYQCYTATGSVNLLVCTNWYVTYLTSETRARLYLSGATAVVLPSSFYNLGSSNYISGITNLLLLVKAPGCTNVGYSVWGVK